MGIGKRALFTEYYLDELPQIIQAWNRLHGMEEETRQVDAMAFLGSGGEVVEG